VLGNLVGERWVELGFAVLAPQDVFAGAAVALALVGMAGAVAALAVSSRRAA
jgi:hypothetical protein